MTVEITVMMSLSNLIGQSSFSGSSDPPASPCKVVGRAWRAGQVGG